MDDSDEYSEPERPVRDDDEDDDIVVRPGRRAKQAVTAQRQKAQDVQRRKKLARRAGGAKGDYAWTSEYQRSWDTVQEDESGSIAGVVAGIIEAGKRKRLLKDATPVQRGIIRHLVLVLDFGAAMAEKDLRPSRHELSLNYACDFVNEYFEQNPISQLAIIGMRDGVASMVSPLGGNPQDHIAALRARKTYECSGDASLQNSLEIARATLFHVPAHGTREILMIYGGLVSSDPGDVRQTIASLVQDKIRVRIVGLAASLAICREIVRLTNGGNAEGYGVILDEYHFKDLLMLATTPPATTTAAARKKTSLIMIGFPSRVDEEEATLCACHGRITNAGYYCPRCSSKVCSLPVECPVCSLTLILSTHLARSYHHLFPLRNWEEVSWEDAELSTSCFACQATFPPAQKLSRRGRADAAAIDKANPAISAASAAAAAAAQQQQSSRRYGCPQCRQHFCVECDIFAHEVMFECPGCQAGARARAVRAERRQLGLADAEAEVVSDDDADMSDEQVEADEQAANTEDADVPDAEASPPAVAPGGMNGDAHVESITNGNSNGKIKDNRSMRGKLKAAKLGGGGGTVNAKPRKRRAILDDEDDEEEEEQAADRTGADADADMADA